MVTYECNLDTYGQSQEHATKLDGECLTSVKIKSTGLPAERTSKSETAIGGDITTSPYTQNGVALTVIIVKANSGQFRSN